MAVYFMFIPKKAVQDLTTDRLTYKLITQYFGYRNYDRTVGTSQH